MPHYKTITQLAILVLMLMGCATTQQIPDVIRSPLATNITLGAAQSQPQTMIGQMVRWGGIIIGVTNNLGHAEFEIIAKPLTTNGRPQAGDATYGRFIIHATGFYDPAVYSTNREITVYGSLRDIVDKPIGELNYSYPIVEANQLYLWPDTSNYPYYDQPLFNIGIGIGGGFSL